MRVHPGTVTRGIYNLFIVSAVAGVTFQGVSKIYPDGTRAVNNLNLGIEDGEFLVLVGPSGCGKTTALRMVAGLEDISEGQLKIGDRVVNHVPSRDRDIAMVFQSYALYPHLSVYDNIAFSLKLKKMDKKETERRVKNAARLLGLEPYLDRKPRALSGGQRQRVAMGRAIVREPAAFLMDEPLSNLDAKLRVQTRAEIKKLQDDLGTTTIYVTHDQVEAMTMGDRVAVMRKGELQQVDAPQALYDRPVNLFVGGFIGSPAMNLVEATLERADGGLAAVAGSQRIALGEETLSARPGLKDYEGRDVILGIRPEDLEDAELEPDRGQTIEGTIELTEALGSEIMAHFSIDAPPAITDEVRELQEDAGTTEGVGTPAQDEEGGRTIMVGRFGARSKAAKGEPIRAAVDTRALHFFDPETGLGIYDGTEREGATE
jgi:multiple sugar transport system ATP-binding protein